MSQNGKRINENAGNIIEKIKTQEKNNQIDVKSFVQDRFFEKGNWWLKIRQILLNLVFLAILVIPIIILFNSILEGKISENFYFWSHQDGFDLADYLKSFILIAFIFVLVASLAFVFRNNHLEQKVYPKRKTYDEKKLEARKIILNEMYTERFGEQKFRESTRYYVVEGKQNLPDRMVDDLFKEGKVEIK